MFETDSTDSELPIRIAHRPLAAPNRSGEGGSRACGRARSVPLWSLAAALMLALPALLAASPADAACGIRDRLSHRESECLSASWENRPGTSMFPNWYEVRNMCSDLGRVVVKVDLAGDMDRTLHLYGDGVRVGYVEARIRWIYCCKDLSDVCNRSDADGDTAQTSVPAQPDNPDGTSAGNTAATVAGVDFDNTPPVKSWLTGVGREVASAQVDSLGEQLAGVGRQSHLTLGGVRTALSPRAEPFDPGDDASARAERRQARTAQGLAGIHDGAPGHSDSRGTSGRNTLSDSSFLFTAGDAAGSGGRLSGWGQAMPMGFAEADGAQGAGTLTLLGVDRARGRLSAGVAFSHGALAGDLAGGKGDGIEATLTGVHPYARLALTDRLAVWGALGYGAGAMTMSDGALYEGLSPHWQAGIAMSMAAVGAGGSLLTEEEDGLALSLKSDAYVMRMTSEVAAPGAGTLAATEIVGSRMRLALDGSRRFEVGREGSLTPALGAELRHEGGDGATGTGVELSAAMHYEAPHLAMAAQLRAGLGGAGERETWRASLSARRDFGKAMHAPILSLSPSWEVVGDETGELEHRFMIRGRMPLGGGGTMAVR